MTSHSHKAQGPWAIARRRFFRNIPATLALIYLGLNALFAICAYWVIPDSTANANFQIVQLPKQAPGTQTTLLLQPLWPQPPRPSWLTAFFSGNPDRFIPHPVRSVQPIAKDSSSVLTTGLRGEVDTVDVFGFLLPIDKLSPWTAQQLDNHDLPYKVGQGRVEYMNLDGQLASASTDSLKHVFYSNHIESKTFRLGTDGAGRDVLSRLILGARVTLGVGFMSVVVSLLIGLFMGSMAGFFRGRVDSLVMWFTSVVWSVPTLMLAIALAFGLGKGTWQLFLAIGAGTWVEVARIVRGQIFTLREMQYVEAAKALGFRSARTIIRHVLPNVTGPLIIIAAANFAAAVLLESGLSFLGVGVQPPTPSWGGMIREGYTQVMFDSGAWLAIFPGMAIVLVVVSLNLVGFGLRDAFDPVKKDSA